MKSGRSWEWFGSMGGHDWLWVAIQNRAIHNTTIYPFPNGVSRAHVFQKGVLNFIGVPLLVSQQNTKPARPVYNNRGTGSGTLWDRYSKDLISYRYLASAAASPKMNKILVEELIKNARVPKTKRNRIWHQSGCKCWVCNISTLRVLANTPTPPRGFPSRAYLLYQLKDYTPRT